VSAHAGTGICGLFCPAASTPYQPKEDSRRQQVAECLIFNLINRLAQYYLYLAHCYIWKRKNDIKDEFISSF